MDNGVGGAAPRGAASGAGPGAGQLIYRFEKDPEEMKKVLLGLDELSLDPPRPGLATST